MAGLFSFGKDKSSTILKNGNSVTIEGFKETYEKLKRSMDFYTTTPKIQEVMADSFNKNKIATLSPDKLSAREKYLNDLADEIEVHEQGFFQAKTRLDRSISINPKIKEKLSGKGFEFDILARTTVGNIRKAAAIYHKALDDMFPSVPKTILSPVTYNLQQRLAALKSNSVSKGGVSKKTRKHRRVSRRKQTRRR